MQVFEKNIVNIKIFLFRLEDSYQLELVLVMNTHTTTFYDNMASLRYF